MPAVTLAIASLCATNATAAAWAPDQTEGLHAWYTADAIAGLADGEIATRWQDSGPRMMCLGKRSGSPVFVAELKGDPGFTVFVVATVTRPTGKYAHPVGWGHGAALER